MMALHNLATVFAPNLLRKADSNALGMVVDTPLINSCFNILLRDFDYVFGVSNPYSLLPSNDFFLLRPFLCKN